MTDPASPFAIQYLAQRRDLRTGFGYGLGRRTAMLVEAAMAALADGPKQVDVVDFGCAEGAMVEALAAAFGERFRSGVGLDVFRSGPPPDQPEFGLRFITCDLFRTYPYPMADASADLAVASAFLKHHPDTTRFLGEVARVLRPGGAAVILDPRPAVVRIGMKFGRFNPDYNPSLWSKRTIERLLEGTPLGLQLRIEMFRRYWLAPNHAMHRLGIEQALPRSVTGAFGMHQCMVLRRL